MSIGSSLARGWDQHAVRPVFREGVVTNYINYHRPEHQCCLVMPQPSGYYNINFMSEAQEYLSLKYYKMVTISFPGLNTHKILNDIPIPSGPFGGWSVRESLQFFKNAERSSLILGSNDWEKKFRKLSTDKALDQFFELITQLYNHTNFKVVFISTIFPRIPFYNNNQIDYKLTAFNQGLVEAKKNSLYAERLKITNRQGEEKILKWRLVDMTEQFYDSKMLNRNSYCDFYRDGIHIKASLSELYLSEMNKSVKRYLKRRK